MAVKYGVLDSAGYERINDALNTASVKTEIIHLSGKSEVLGYFKQEYGESWRPKAADLIQQLEPNAKRASILRRLQGTRADAAPKTKPAEARQNAQYKALGKLLPGTEIQTDLPVAGKKAKVQAKVKIKISKDKKARERNIDVTMSSSQMAALRDGDWEGLIDAYGGINPEGIEYLAIDSIDVQYQGV